MKQLSLLAVFAAVAATLSSCLEGVENKTVVHPDGSITRTILFTGDSSAIARRNFKLRIDSTWSIITAPDKEKTWTLKAERVFQDDRVMNDALSGEPGKTLTASVRLEKSFQWFFTGYRYKETWKCYRLVEAVPMSKYITDRDLDIIDKFEVRKEEASMKDSLTLKVFEEKYKEWRAANLFEAYYKEFLKGVETLHSPLLTVPAVEGHKTELLRTSAEKIENAEKDLKQVEQLFAATLHSPLVGDAFRANATGFASLVAKVEYEESMWTLRSFKAAVTMPGVITSTNARGVDGSTAKWEDFIIMGLFRDTDLSVESRTVNWWAVVVTGVIVAAILVYLVVALVRRKPATA